MICTHQFLEIDKVSKPTEVTFRTEWGIKVACTLCGEIRHIWPDGEVEVVIEGKGITKKDDGKHRTE